MPGRQINMSRGKGGWRGPSRRYALHFLFHCRRVGGSESYIGWGWLATEDARPRFQNAWNIVPLATVHPFLYKRHNPYKLCRKWEYTVSSLVDLVQCRRRRLTCLVGITLLSYSHFFTAYFSVRTPSFSNSPFFFFISKQKVHISLSIPLFCCYFLYEMEASWLTLIYKTSFNQMCLNICNTRSIPKLIAYPITRQTKS